MDAAAGMTRLLHESLDEFPGTIHFDDTLCFPGRMTAPDPRPMRWMPLDTFDVSASDYDKLVEKLT